MSISSFHWLAAWPWLSRTSHYAAHAALELPLIRRPTPHHPHHPQLCWILLPLFLCLAFPMRGAEASVAAQGLLTVLHCMSFSFEMAMRLGAAIWPILTGTQSLAASTSQVTGWQWMPTGMAQACLHAHGRAQQPFWNWVPCLGFRSQRQALWQPSGSPGQKTKGKFYKCLWKHLIKIQLSLVQICFAICSRVTNSKEVEEL